MVLSLGKRKEKKRVEFAENAVCAEKIVGEQLA